MLEDALEKSTHRQPIAHHRPKAVRDHMDEIELPRSRPLLPPRRDPGSGDKRVVSPTNHRPLLPCVTLLDARPSYFPTWEAEWQRTRLCTLPRRASPICCATESRATMISRSHETSAGTKYRKVSCFPPGTVSREEVSCERRGSQRTARKRNGEERKSTKRRAPQFTKALPSKR